ncbi:MAG: FtsQ-type POTRA domain-containing protein [Erysipelotrichaceae bacterium]|nr:FtsQ-type POTRA domain-containing protein [Erysipelotrichaceae bacterium]
MGKSVDDRILDQSYDPFEEERRRKKEQLRRKKRRRRVRLTRISMALLFVFLVAFLYFMSEGSKVKSIRLENDSYLSDEYILTLSKLDYNSRYWLVFSPLVEMRLEHNPCIKNAQVKHVNDHGIVIKIEEEKGIGYYWTEDLNLVLGNGSIIKMSQEFYSSLKNLPLIKDGTSKEEIDQLVQQMKGVDSKVISHITEIWKYTSSYDADMVRFLMSDGNQVFSSKDSIPLLDNYLRIAKSLKKKNVCLVLDRSTSSAYTKSCATLLEEEKKALEKLAGNVSEENLEENIEESGS